MTMAVDGPMKRVVLKLRVPVWVRRTSGAGWITSVSWASTNELKSDEGAASLKSNMKN